MRVFYTNCSSCSIQLPMMRVKKAAELNEMINKSLASTERYLKILKEKGFIEFRGAPKTGGYFVKD